MQIETVLMFRCTSISGNKTRDYYAGFIEAHTKTKHVMSRSQGWLINSGCYKFITGFTIF